MGQLGCRQVIQADQETAASALPGRSLARMVDQRLPLNVGGTLGAPSILPNFGAMVREEVQEAVDEAVEEEKQELEQEIEQERDEAVESFRDRLRRRLEQ